MSLRARSAAVRRLLRPSAALLCLLAVPPTVGCGDRPAGEAAREESAPAPDYESMSFPYEFTPAQKRAVGRFLDGRAGWRLAVATDNTSPLLGRMKRDHPEYEPYLAEDDLTGDDREDLVVVVTNGDGAFRVVWFRSAGREYAPPRPLASASWLDAGGLFVQDGDLVVGRFYSDQGRTYAWNPETRRPECHDLLTGEPCP